MALQKSGAKAGYTPGMIPIWLTLATTLLTLVVVLIYWQRFGPGNLLWFCDVALILLVPALWLESALLSSLAALLVLLPLLLWAVLLALRLGLGWRCGGLLDYLFIRERPLWLRLISLFHLPLPVLMLWLLWRLGYSAEALPWAIVTTWLVLPLSYCFSRPQHNVNWVHGIGGEGTRQTRLPPMIHLLMLMLAAVILIHLPSHWLLTWLFPAA